MQYITRAVIGGGADPSSQDHPTPHYYPLPPTAREYLHPFGKAVKREPCLYCRLQIGKVFIRSTRHYLVSRSVEELKIIVSVIMCFSEGSLMNGKPS